MLLGINACDRDRDSDPKLVLKKTSYNKLSGWKKDKVHKALPALQKSCALVLKRPDHYDMGMGCTASDWKEACAAITGLQNPSTQDLRTTLETHFVPYLVQDKDKDHGMMTGYYEAEIKGSPVRTAKFNIPVYGRPLDLVSAEDMGTFNPSLSGRRISGRIRNGTIVPHYSHGEILKGALKNKGLELFWTDSQVDLFFMQVQGSGRVVMTDGTTKRYGYSGANGHPYKSVAKELIDMGEMTLDTASMQTIRKWFQQNPKRLHEILAKNPSYVFFKEAELKDVNGGPVGAQNLQLTPKRSIAIDKKYIPLGIPLWVVTNHPGKNKKFEKLVVSQDTGGAIKGVVRADIFWGAGPKASAYAGNMKHQGKLYVLLPKHIEPKA